LEKWENAGGAGVRLGFELGEQGFAELGVAGETETFPGAVLEAFEVFLEERVFRFRDAINHPLRNALALDHPEILHVAELLGDFHLIGIKDLHEVADTERPILKKIQDAEALLVAQTLVDVDDFHASVYAHSWICSQGK
jgi:hypothetical protein